MAFGFLFAFGLLVARGVLRSTRRLLAFSALVLSWVTIAGIFGEWGENYRFRYDIVWLAWMTALGGYVACLRVLGALARRGRARLARDVLIKSSRRVATHGF